ncbi:hypothetical protein ACLBPK_28200, partial [Klebsiella pneumoniae]|uniref:hypothetical protein n=1 Tax=Klebsiella pneumoniae TaxID=573 RepID=UPI003968C497
GVSPQRYWGAPIPMGEITERQPARGVQGHDFLPNGGDSLAINPGGRKMLLSADSSLFMPPR